MDRSTDSLCAAWGYWRFTKTPHHRARQAIRAISLYDQTSYKTGQRTRSERLIASPYRRRIDTSTWRKSRISSLEMFIAGSYPTALKRNSSVSVWDGFEEQPHTRDSHSDKGCQFTSTDFVSTLLGRRPRSAGQSKMDAKTSFWLSDCGEPSNIRRCVCMPITIAGKQRSAWLSSY